MDQYRGLLGLAVMAGIAWLLSSARRRVRVRVVVAGLALQFGFAWLILRTRAGKSFFDGVNGFFTTLLGFVSAGTEFVFGSMFEEHKFTFALGVLPTIVFFSALMSVMYHLGVMQRLIGLMARVMQSTLRTSGAETLSASANIFVGHTEAPLVIRPYLATMTRSELNAVMVGGFATISGGLLAGLVNLGIDAGHLLTASVISAPAGLAIAKIMQPELDQPQTLGRVDVEVESQAANVIEAAANGATDGMKLAINVMAMLIAFLALIAMADWVVGWIGSLFGYVDDGVPRWSLTAGLGYVFSPVAWLMGIESAECLHAGELLGVKTVGNEFVAYIQLSEWSQLPPEAAVLSERSQQIMTYALSGFSNFGAIGIQIAGIGGLAPERQGDLARLGLRAMIGGALACCMTACVAGVLL